MSTELPKSIQKSSPLLGLIGHLDISTSAYETEELYVKALNLYFGRIGCLSVLLITVIFAPPDFFYLQDYPTKLHALVQWRIVFFIVLFFCWRWTLRHPVAYYNWKQWLLVVILWGMIGSYFVVQFGPFTEPWFYVFLFAPFSTTLLIVDIKQRFWGNMLIIASIFFTALLVNPTYFFIPFSSVYLSYTILSVGLAITIGDLYAKRVLKNYRNFAARRRRNESLTEEIEQKTREATRALLDAEIVQEQTRLELSRELHDELGHLIAVHNISLHELMSEQADKIGVVLTTESFIEELQDIERGARRVIKELRSNLVLDDPVYLSLIEWLHAFGRDTALKIEPIIEPEDITFDKRVAFVVSRFIQEALHNVHKHAEATKIEVCILEEPDHHLISVRDNGKGFAPDQISSGAGLAGIEERVKTLSGQLQIESNQEEGTELMVTIPRLPYIVRRLP